MEKEEKLSFSDKLGKWILKNRVVLISILVTIFVAAVVCVIAFSAVSKNTEKKFADLYALTTEYNAVVVTDLSEEEKFAESQAILTDVLAIADANAKNGVGIRAYMFAAEIQFANNDFANAADAWEKAAKANLKVYTAPLSFYNAAVCYEELGKYDAAIASLKKAIESDDFALKAKAIFNIGRLEETIENYAAAADAYNDIIQNYSSLEVYNFAKSRLIYLKEQGLLN